LVYQNQQIIPTINPEQLFDRGSIKRILFLFYLILSRFWKLQIKPITSYQNALSKKQKNEIPKPAKNGYKGNPKDQIPLRFKFFIPQL